MKVFLISLAAVIMIFFVYRIVKNNNSDSEVSFEGHKVEVQEAVQTTTGYTYMRVTEKGSFDYWIAVTQMEVEKGDVLYYQTSMPMENFQSPELGRTFDLVYFIQEIATSPDAFKVQMPAGHGMVGDQTQTGSSKVEEAVEISIAPPDGGISIGELIKNKKEYKGKSIKVSGIVVKFTPEVMNKNWIHIQDGSQHDGEFDLTITSMDNVAEGDTVSFEGTIDLDKDFGAGYVYSLIMEEASLQISK